MRNKKYFFDLSSTASPTHFNLVNAMQRVGFKKNRWPWHMAFREKHLNFAPDACECLEFKHNLSQLTLNHCPDVMPKTYVIDDHNWPTVLNQLADEYYTNQYGLTDKIEKLAWILKPALLNNGQDIKIFDRLSQIESHFMSFNRLGGPHVLQRYVINPDLYQERKYSLRFFVVITQNAGAFLYRHGYLNVALESYAEADYSRLNGHLTNEHLNHDIPNVIQIPTIITMQYPNWYSQIKPIVQSVTNALEQAFPHAYHIKKEDALAIFGFDFMMDSDYKMWLLEVNHGPCFPIEPHHPLQKPLYESFWTNLVKQMIEPMIKKQSVDLKSGHDFDCMRT